MAAEAAATETQLVADRAEALGTQVRGGRPLAPGPQAFDRIQLRGIGREAMHCEPRALGLDVGAGLEAAVRVESVPEQDHAPSDVTPQVTEEAHHLGRPDGAWVGHQEDAAAARGANAVGQGPDHREGIPAAEPVGQDRCLPARRPGAADRWALGEAALVDEDDRRPVMRGVFFRAGHVVFTQRWIASSSRSLARVVGFCNDQPSWCITRHTWPGW
jgi:hypothetical protein